MKLRQISVDPTVEADAYRFAAGVLASEKLGAVLRNRYDLSNDYATGDWLTWPLFAAVFGYFGDVKTYEVPGHFPLEIGEVPASVRQVLKASQRSFDYISAHSWDVITRHRRAILTHYGGAFAASVPEGLYARVSQWYLAFGTRGLTLVEAIEARSHGHVSLCISRRRPAEMGSLDVPHVHFPGTAIAALSARLPFHPDCEETVPDLEDTLGQALDGLRAGHRQQLETFGRVLGRALGSTFELQEAAHIALGLHGWDVTVGILPYFFFGHKHKAMLGVSVSAPRRAGRTEIAPTLPGQLRGLVRGLGTALLTAQHDVVDYFRARARLSQFLKHDAKKTIDIVEMTTAQAAEEVGGQLGLDLGLCAHEARYLYELTQLFSILPFPSDRVVTTRTGAPTDVGSVLSAMAQRDRKLEGGLCAVTSVVTLDGTEIPFGTLATTPAVSCGTVAVREAPLRLMLENLLKNAGSVLEAGSRIVISVRAIVLESHDGVEVPGLEIAVADSGSAIPLEPRPSPDGHRGHEIIKAVVDAVCQAGCPASFHLPSRGSVGMDQKVFRLRLPAGVENL